MSLTTTSSAAFLAPAGPAPLLRPLPPSHPPLPAKTPTALWPRRPRPLTALPSVGKSLLSRGLEAVSTTTTTGGGGGGGAGGTWASLVGSAALGLALERRTPAGRALGGSLLAFLLQAAAANSGLAPAASPAYDACWGGVLPASLSLSVLLAVDAAGAAAASGAAASGSAVRRGGRQGRATRWMASSLGKVSIAYFWGALGSLAGTILAFHATAALFPSAAAGGGLARPVLARVAAAVAATYVGGSVNFFQVARAVGLGEGEGGQGLMGAVAGADIFLMALYFAALVRWSVMWMMRCLLSVTGAAADVPTDDATYPYPQYQIGMQRSQPRGMAAFLQPGKSTAADTRPGKRHGRSPDPVLVEMPASTTTTSRSSSTNSSLHLPKPLQHLAAFALAAALGQAGQAAERRAGIPGAAAAATTALSLAAYSLCRRLRPRLFRALAARAPGLSAFLFALFFAAIGAGASLRHLLVLGPAVLLLMAMALLVHVGTTAVALRLHNAAMAKTSNGGDGCCAVGVDEMVIASNANIGGPATAAAMAASVGRPDLVLAATATGSFGYCAATWLGVAVYGWLMRGGGG